MQPVHQVHKKATSGGGGPRHRLLSSVLYTITSIQERYGTQEVVATKSSRYRRVVKDRACRTAPLEDSPSINPQGTLRCLINNTVGFRAPDLLMLRSQTLKMYLTL